MEAKRPDEPIEAALREAQLYANRFPPNINPISYVLACYGQQFALAAADSETEVLYAEVEDMRPGTEMRGKYDRAFFIYEKFLGMVLAAPTFSIRSASW